MAPRGRKRKGLMREDAARDAMLEFGFGCPLINKTIKELLNLYGEEPNTNPWKLIEEGGYSVLLERLLEKQEEQDKQLALCNEKLAVAEHEEPAQEEEEEKEQERHDEEGSYEIGSTSTSLLALPNVGLAVEEKEEPAQEEEEEEKEKDHQARDQIGCSSASPVGYGAETRAQTCHVEEAKALIGSSSTSLVGNGAETGAQVCQTEATSVSVGVIKEEVMESPPGPPPGYQSKKATADSIKVTDEAVTGSSAAALQSREGTADSIGVNDEAVTDLSPAALKSEEATADSVGVTIGMAMDSSPTGFQSGEATADAIGGIKSSHCGWLSEESDSEEDDDDDDGKMIQLSPEPLCEELEELLAEIRKESKEKKRKRPSRWDT